MADIIELGMRVRTAELRRAKNELHDFGTETKEAERGTREVGAAAATAGRQVGGYATAAKAAAVASNAGTRGAGMFAAALTRAGAQAAAVAGTALAMGATVHTLANFEREVASVSAITGSTGEDLEKLRQEAARLGGTTEFSATQGAQALKFLGAAGLSATQSIQAVPAVLDLATATQMDLGTAAESTTKILASFGMEATRAAEATDVLAATANNTTAGVLDLAEGIKFAGPVARGLGISLNDTAAALGVLADTGLSGGLGGNGLKRVLSGLLDPTKEAADTIKALGINIKDLDPATHSLVEIFQRLHDAGMDVADAMKIAGLEGGPALLNLVNNADRLEELTGKLQDVDGATSKMAATMRDQLGGDTDNLMSSVEGLILALGEAGLTAVLRVGIAALTGMVRALTELVTWMGKGIAIVTDMLGLVSEETERRARLNEVIEDTGTETKDLLEHVNRLTSATDTNAAATLDSAKAQLADAQARRQNIDTIREERRQRLLLALGWDDLTAQIEDARMAVDALAPPSRDLEDAPARLAEGYEQAQQNLVDLLTQRQKLKDEAAATALTPEEQAAAEALDRQIASLEKIIANWGKTKPAVRAVTTEVDKLNDSTDKLAEKIAQDVAERMREQQDRALSIYDATRTEAEHLAQILDELRALNQGGFIDDDTFQRATKQAKEPLERDLQDVDMTLPGFQQEAQLEQLRAFEEEKLQIVRDALEARILTEQEAHARIQEIEKLGAMERQNLMLSSYATQLGAAQNAFGGMAAALKESVGEQSTAYRTLFAIQQAFAIASAVINTAVAVNKALAEYPPPMNFIMAGVTAATGAIQVATIIAQTFSGGAYADGTNFAKGGLSLVGEEGPELVNLPRGSRVRTAGDTASVLDSFMGQQPAPVAPEVKLDNKIINVIDPSMVGQYLRTTEGENMVLNIVRANKEALVA